MNWWGKPKNVKLKYFLEKMTLCDMWKLFFLWRWRSQDAVVFKFERCGHRDDTSIVGGDQEGLSTQKTIKGGSYLSWIFLGAWKSVRLKHYPAYPIIIISLIIQSNLATKIWAKWESGLTTVWLKWDPPVTLHTFLISIYNRSANPYVYTFLAQLKAFSSTIPITLL